MPPTPHEYCVYNETRENLLSFRVAVVDTRSEPLRAVKVLIEGLAPNAATGLWLNPLRSIPAVPRLSPYDLVYLDRDGYIVHGVELVPDDEAPPRIDSAAASALLLPIHTFAASRAVPGDRFVLRRADEMFAVADLPSAALATSAPPATPDPSAVAASITSSAATETPVAVLARASSASVIEPLPPEKLPPLAWPAPDAPPLASLCESFVPATALSPASPEIQPPSHPKAPRIPLLRSLAHLRIHIHISIATGPGMTAAVSPRPARANRPRPTARQFLIHPLTQLSGNTIAILRPRAVQASTLLHHQWTACKTAYLRWAESFIFRPADKPAQRLSTVPPEPMLPSPIGTARKPRFLR